MSFCLDVCENTMRLPHIMACVGYLFNKLAMANAKIIFLGTDSKQPSTCPKECSLNISWFWPRTGLICSVIVRGCEHYFTNVMENPTGLIASWGSKCGGGSDRASMILSRGRRLGGVASVSSASALSLLCTF